MDRSEYAKQYRERNKEKLREYYRKWYRERGRLGKRVSSPEKRDAIRVAIKAWQKENPEKIRAHQKVSDALRNRTLKNPGVCSQCGKMTSYLDAHHADYSKPLDVMWVCLRCHRRIHAALREKKQKPPAGHK